MRKVDAIKLLGGSVASTADAIGISYQAVDKWPEELPDRIEDRVVAAIVRRHLAKALDTLVAELCRESESQAA